MPTKPPRCGGFVVLTALGGDRSSSGEVIGYHSFHPYAKSESALLTRVTDGTKSIEWETARIPLDFTEEFAHFVWIASHSSGTSSGNRTFRLFIDNEEWLAFTTTPNKGLRQWVFTGKDGAELKFRAEWEDTACITLESIRPLR